jgi:hypothetical protein
MDPTSGLPTRYDGWYPLRQIEVSTHKETGAEIGLPKLRTSWWRSNDGCFET